jgi:hypothetical protein
VQLEVGPVKRANQVPIEAATDPALNANRGAQVKVRGAPVRVAKYRQAPVQGEARAAVQGEAKGGCAGEAKIGYSQETHYFAPVSIRVMH